MSESALFFAACAIWNARVAKIVRKFLARVGIGPKRSVLFENGEREFIFIAIKRQGIR